MRRLGLALAYGTFVSALWAGCSSSGDNSGSGAFGGSSGAGASAGAGAAPDGSTGGSGGSSTGGSGGSSTGGSGGSSTGGSGGSSTGGSFGDGAIPDVSFNYDAPEPQQDACAAVTVQAQLTPLDLYVVLDRSGSMVNSSLGPLRWPPVRDALNAFFQSPSTAGIGIALTMFAHPTASECSPASYATPLVAMAPLPGSATGHAITLQNTMNQYAPVLGIGTPTKSAMTGAVTFAKNHKIANPGRTVALVLATDGLPGAAGCTGEDAPGTQAAIAAGFTGTPSIRTYVIGIDPTAQMSTNLNAWANAGGGQAFDVGTAGGPTQFLNAMKSIQSSLLGCNFAMPTTDAGIIQTDKVKVVFTPGAGGPTQLPRVNDQSACSGPGWYYDNNANPTSIILCPGSCTTVQADPSGKVDIELGCLGS
jgi:hypothetical protein